MNKNGWNWHKKKYSKFQDIKKNYLFLNGGAKAPLAPTPSATAYNPFDQYYYLHGEVRRRQSQQWC